MKFRHALVAAVSIALCAASTASAEDFVEDGHDVLVETDVTYTQGIVGASSEPHLRDLKMDVYRPLNDGSAMAHRPAVILAFGGAYHRGSKGTTRFEEDGASDTPMGEYCQMLAAAGYVCMSIEYRLVPDDPAMPDELDGSILFPKSSLTDPAATARVDVVRQRMGLPLIDDDSRTQVWNTLFASTQDLVRAVEFARSDPDRFGLDPERIAIGGFSAGAITAINAAYGEGAPVKAVLSLSGSMVGYDIRKSAKPDMPPGLFILGQNDLAGMHLGTQAVLASLRGAGASAESAWMPGFGHFYPMSAPSLGADMRKMSLKRRILEFLDRTIGSE